MRKDRPNQAKFREKLIQEHYQVFQNYPIFCHLSLLGVLFNQRPVLVEAHHIQPYARVHRYDFCDTNANGLLIVSALHRAIHKEYEKNRGRIDVEDITRQWAGFYYRTNWRQYKDYVLPSGDYLVENWHRLLQSKNLI